MKHRVVVAAQGQVVDVVYFQDGGAAVGAIQGINQQHPRLPSASPPTARSSTDYGFLATPP